MLSRRLQILVDDERYRRLEAEANRRRVPVAVVVRDAIDRAYPSDDGARRAAAEAILTAEPVPVPATVEELKTEIRTAHERVG